MNKSNQKKMISIKRTRFKFLFLTFSTIAVLVFYKFISKAKPCSQFVEAVNMLSSQKSSKLKINGRFSQLPPESETITHSRRVTQVNCKKLFIGDKREQLQAKTISDAKPKVSSLPKLRQLLKTCTLFRQNRGYYKHCTSPLEQEFPLAFSILMYKSSEQVERLLRMIYRPQNVYCIHVDRKADIADIETMVKIASCLKENVFLSSKSIDVRWGAPSLLDAELLCMEELLNRSSVWKYLINLTGQELPLKTNYELVKILRAYDGANDIEGTIKRLNKNRFLKAGPPPMNMTVTKGSVHIVANRDFVNYAIFNPKARTLRQWAKKVLIPEEMFFSTLNYNPQLGVRGTYNGDDLETNNVKKPFIARFVIWKHPSQTCHGKYVSDVCVLGIGNLPQLHESKEMFANKFYWDLQHFTMDCMEELYYNRTADECLGRSTFNESYYRKLDFVLNKV